MPRIPMGPVDLDILDGKSVISEIKQFIKSRNPSQIITLNSLMFNAAFDDPDCANAIKNASLVVPDSIGITWAAKFLSGSVAARYAGIDLLFDICREAESSGYRIFLLGAAHGIAQKAGEKLREKFPKLEIAGAHHGYLMKDELNCVIDIIRKSRADILFVGMSIPRQEKWVARNLKTLGVPVVMGVGGSFDVISGFLKRAPRWMQDAGLEWVFRTLQQPWRFFRILNLPFFILNVIKLRLITQIKK
ncbi:MAG: WecB/TagA/CpsF family glycosyltransferase [Elusimicrobiota bacterium]